MRILITGSRTWDDADYIWKVLDELLTQSDSDGRLLELWHGACTKGADAHADAWARERVSEGRRVLVGRFLAKWRNDAGDFDRTAGFTRNREMVELLTPEYAARDKRACHAFIREHSAGATHCANLAAKAGIPVIRHRWEDR